MDNVKEAVEVRGSTLKEIEQSALFLDRSQWKSFVTDKPVLRYKIQLSLQSNSISAPKIARQRLVTSRIIA